MHKSPTLPCQEISTFQCLQLLSRHPPRHPLQHRLNLQVTLSHLWKRVTNLTFCTPSKTPKDLWWWLGESRWLAETKSPKYLHHSHCGDWKGRGVCICILTYPHLCSHNWMHAYLLCSVTLFDILPLSLQWNMMGQTVTLSDVSPSLTVMDLKKLIKEQSLSLSLSPSLSLSHIVDSLIPSHSDMLESHQISRNSNVISMVSWKVSCIYLFHFLFTNNHNYPS